MSEDFENSFFFSLPKEIVIKILGLVGALNASQFCEAYSCDYFLQERDVVRTFDISKRYDLDNLDLDSLLKKFNFNHVTTLNVNGLYWIQAAELRKLISRMVNLETLYAMQTLFSLTSNDTLVLSNSKIRKLGVTVGEPDKVDPYIIPSIETLYIRVYDVKIFKRTSVDEIFPNLNKLWIEIKEPGEGPTSLNFLKAKTKFFCQNFKRSVDFQRFELTTYYNSRRAEQFPLMCCEKLNAPECVSKTISGGCSDVCWKLLETLKYPRPYGPKDARRIFLNETNLSDICFEELNFVDRCVTYAKYDKPIKHILKSSCASKLKRLCIPLCVLQRDIEVAKYSNNKRMKFGRPSSSRQVKKMFSNFSGLQHLEIYQCYKRCIEDAMEGFYLISMLTNLQTLVVNVAYTGNFLCDVLEKCPIKVLKIFGRDRDDKIYTKLNANVCRYISKTKFLVDFTFENPCISIDALLEKLSLIKTRNLLRVAIICNNCIGKLSLDVLKRFLETNSQLVFLYIQIRESPESVRLIQQTLNFYERKRCCNRFIITRGGSDFPEAHHEMLHCHNNVASLSPLSDFSTF